MEHFRILGEFDLEKSANAGSSDSVKDYIIKGRILNSVRDASGETPIVPEFDWSHFDQNGWIKYEHDPLTNVVLKGKSITFAVPTARNYIGVPLSREVINDREVMIKGTLFPNMEESDHVLKLAKAIEDHNKRYPAKRRTLGFSIEGQYLKKSMDGKYAGRVLNVVITPQPQDASTYLELTTESNLQMAKSLAAGYGTSPESKTGGAAIVKEHITTSTKEKKGMEKFSSRQQCYAHHLSKGLPKDQAKAKADEWATEQANARSANTSAFTKSHTDAVALFRKSLDTLNAYCTAQEQRTLEANGADVKLKKSVSARTTDGQIDGDAFFSALADSISGLAGTIQTGQVDLAKSQASQAEGMVIMLDLIKGLSERVEAIAEQSQATIERVDGITNGLRKSNGAIQLTGLETINADGAPPAGEPMLKGISRLVVQEFLVNRGAAEKATGNESGAQTYFQAHTEYRIHGEKALSKSIIAEITTTFGTAH